MKLRLQNFQSHVDTEIELAPAGQLTVITGPTDSGKTALIRGFRWVAYNDPQGDSFIRVSAQTCRVTVTLDDGTQVIRERSRGGVNRYILARPGEEPVRFESFGTSVPLEIRQALNISELRIEGLPEPIRPQLAEQLDGPFLGRHIPATGRAKVLGALAGVDAVDAANKATGTDLYRAAREVERLEAELKVNAEEQSGLAWVEPFGANLERLTELHATATAAESRRAKLVALAAKVTAHEAEAARVRATLVRLAALPQVARLAGDVDTAADRAAKLVALADRLRTNQTESARVAADVARLGRVNGAADALARVIDAATRAKQLWRVADALRDAAAQRARIDAVLATRSTLARATELLAAANAAVTRRTTLTALAARLSRVTAGAEEIRQAAVLAEHNLAEARAAYADAMAEATVVCPKCGHEFVPENLKEVA